MVPGVLQDEVWVDEDPAHVAHEVPVPPAFKVLALLEKADVELRIWPFLQFFCAVFKFKSAGALAAYFVFFFC